MTSADLVLRNTSNEFKLLLCSTEDVLFIMISVQKFYVIVSESVQRNWLFSFVLDLRNDTLILI